MKLSLQKIATFLSIKTTSTLSVDTYAIDSRNVQKGGLFFALPGKRVHGESFLEGAKNMGASSAMVSKSYQGKDFGLDLLVVDDVLDSLQLLAQKLVKECGFTVIGITGSVGKTSTKETLYHLLSTAKTVSVTKKNYNTKRSLPLGILEANRDDEYLLLEMGMTKSGHIQRLTEIATPEYVLLTEIGYCHNEFFNSLDAIAAAKAEILTPQVKYAVIHEKSMQHKVVYEKCIFDHDIYPQKIPLCSPYTYKPFSDNFSAAYLMCKHLGMTDNQLRLASLKLVNITVDSRFQLHTIDDVLFIDDSYNANPMSVRAALTHLKQQSCSGRKIYVCAAMTELGHVSKLAHEEVAHKALDIADVVLCIGKETKAIAQAFVNEGKVGLYFESFDELSKKFFSIVLPNDLVLLKGSKPFALWRLIDLAKGVLNKS